MEEFLRISAGLLALVGIIGCVLPYPGHLFIIAASFCLSYANPELSAPAWVWIVLILLCILGLVVDNITSYLGAKKFGASRAALICCLIGIFAGTFFFPIGLIVGPFAGAFIGEFLITRRGLKQASLSAVGGLLGYVLGVLSKLTIAGAMIVLSVIFLDSYFQMG